MAILLVVATLLAAAGIAKGTQRRAVEPVITGEVRVGETLAVVPADPAAPPFDRFRWATCDTAAYSCEFDGDPDTDPGWRFVEDSNGGNLGSRTLGASELGHILRAFAKYTSQGSQWRLSGAVGPVSEAAQPDEELPPPTVYENANVDPVQGTVYVDEPGPKGPRLLTQAEQLPLGTRVDATRGKAKIVSSKNEASVLQTVTYWAGAFRVGQSGGANAITYARLVGAFAPTASARQPAARRRGRRRLWGKGSCRCGTKGSRGSGSVRGTWWLTAEKPKGTLFKVREGVVVVRDKRSGKRVTLRAGEKYLAGARPRRR